MDYTTLIAASTTAGSIANWVNYAPIQNVATDILSDGENMIYRRLRHWRMKARATGILSTVNDYIALPSLFLEEYYFVITGTHKATLTRKTDQEVVNAYDYDASGNRVSDTPTIYYNDGTNFYFDTIPDSAYPYLLLFHQQPTALGASNATNWLTTYYPRLLRCACMLSAAEYLKDAGQGAFDRTYWDAEFEKELGVAQMESDRASHAAILEARIA